MSSQNTAAAQPTILSGGCQINGDVSVDGDAVVLGAVDGRVDVAGHLEVGSDATIRGDVAAGTMTLQGRIEGDVRCEGVLELTGRIDGNVACGKVDLGSTAMLVGGLRARIISVSEGALYRGEVIIGPDVLEETGAPPATEQGPARRSTAPADVEEDEPAAQEITTAPARGAVSGLLRRRHEMLSRSNGSKD